MHSTLSVNSEMSNEVNNQPQLKPKTGKPNNKVINNRGVDSKMGVNLVILRKARYEQSNNVNNYCNKNNLLQTVNFMKFI